MLFFPDAQMDDQDLNEPVAKVALLKGKQIYFCNFRLIICVYKLVYQLFLLIFNEMCVCTKTREMFKLW